MFYYVKYHKSLNKKIIIPVTLAILLIVQPAVISAISSNHTFAIVAEKGDMIDGVMLENAEDPSLNNVGGVVVFEGEPAGGSIIFTLTDEIARDGDTIDGVTLNSSPNDPDINDFGVVVFESSFDDGGNTVNAIFTQTDLIAAEGDVIDGETLTNVADPSINNAGTVVFEADFDDGSSSVDAIFSQTSLLVKAGDTVGGKLLESVNDPFINNNGEVVFEGRFDDGGNIVTGIFALNTDSLLVQEGDMIDGKVIDSIDHPAMNDNGVLIFNASFDDGGGFIDGIFTQTSLLVQEGDIVEGNVLTNVADPVINNNQDFVFEGDYEIGQDSFFSVILATHTQVVGGELLQIDSTALVLAGLQSSAIWMLPVLAGAAGVGAFYIKTRMNKDN